MQKNFLERKKMITLITFKANTPNTYNTKKDPSSMEGLKSKPAVKINPVNAGLKTTAAWFGFGVVLDRVVTFAGKFLKTKPLTTSIIANGVIAVGAGTYTYIKTQSKK